MPENRKKTGQFEKGASGNPGGRPKIPEEFKEIAKNNSIDALQEVIRILKDKKSSPKDKLKAAEIIMDRGFGKPIQEIESKNLNLNADVSNLTDAELEEQLKAEARRILEG